MPYLGVMAKKSYQQGKAPTQRQLRVGEVIRRRLAEILSRADVHDPDLNRMSITVSEVRSSPDLKIATAFVMPLGGKDEEAALAALRRNKTELRRLLSKDLTLKFLPDLRFVLDATFDRMDETRRLLAEPRVQADVSAADAPTDPDEGA